MSGLQSAMSKCGRFFFHALQPDTLTGVCSGLSFTSAQVDLEATVLAAAGIKSAVNVSFHFLSRVNTRSLLHPWDFYPVGLVHSSRLCTAPSFHPSLPVCAFSFTFSSIIFFFFQSEINQNKSSLDR